MSPILSRIDDFQKSPSDFAVTLVWRWRPDFPIIRRFRAPVAFAAAFDVDAYQAAKLSAQTTARMPSRPRTIQMVDLPCQGFDSKVTYLPQTGHC